MKHHVSCRNSVQVLTCPSKLQWMCGQDHGFYITSKLIESKCLSKVLPLKICCRKYEEIYAPQVEEFCYITDNTYNRNEVRCEST